MLLQLLFPGKCILCGKLLKKGERDLCGICRIEAPGFSDGKRKIPFVDRWTALWYYEAEVRKSLHRYKFRNKRSYAQSYGRLLACRLGAEEFDILSWVPISRQRRFQRGYDQVELVAEAVARELDIAALRTLRKIRDNPPQSGIAGMAQRRANVQGAYEPVNREAVAGKRVLLLDDILTTGATVSECAKMLRSAGAAEVSVAAIAAARKR